VGVVFIIAPWNYPYLTTINTLVPALIAGQYRGAEARLARRSWSGERIAEAFHAERDSRGCVPECRPRPMTRRNELIGRRSFDFINFTGSVGGGQAIERAAAGTFTPLGLELGGKDPGYVREDANLDLAVDVLMDAAMYNAGQCCCGIERIYVQEKLYDSFVEKSVAWVGQLKLGNPFDASTTLGPMAHKRFAQTVRDQTAEAIARGAKPLLDPKKFADDGGAYLAPQILVNVDHSMRVMKEESFGPVVGIMPVKE
jgi:acyl-CoA reductase-like NAD-dependent aldehyde dehydrogenase